MVGITRKIHENPELGYQEFEISKLIRSELDKLDIPYNYPISVTDLGISEPPFVALRANMDALPVQDEWIDDVGLLVPYAKTATPLVSCPVAPFTTALGQWDIDYLS
ncbi:hypothetical protein V6N13_037748 [Hibiscus sabdariffa]|uniref:Uncharacterized protein n=1 Tax=Hibiscus sabdariffa TaxID=183260 RepID=A0ABR2S458_9ROSI